MAIANHANILKTRYTRKWLIPITVFIAVLLVASLLLYTATLPNEKPVPEKIDKLFQLNLKEFANTIKVDNGKLLVLDDFGNLTCFDAQNGDLLWQTDVGEWRSGGILVNNGTVYAGTGFSSVQAVDEATGTPLKRYNGLLSTAWKGPPEAFSVADGRIFIKQDGCNAYNIATGDMLWNAGPLSMYEEGKPHTGTVWSFEGKLVLAGGSYRNGDNWFRGIYRINPDENTLLWSVEGYTYQTPLVYEDKVILSNYGTRESVNLCDSVIAVSISYGVKVWSYDVGVPIFEPAIIGDKLLFAAENGYFYALNLSNGTLAWKTQLASSIPSESGFSPVTVDTENQEVFWACGSTTYKGTPGNFSYKGTLYRMNLATGQNLTKTQIQGDATTPFYTQKNPVIGIALLKKTVYLTVQNDLWVLNRTSFETVRTEQFDHSYDHSLLQPIAAYGQVYVSGGRYAIAYKDIE